MSLHIEYRPFTLDDFSNNPTCFKNDFENENIRLIRHDNCGMILMQGEEPQYYFHNMDEHTSRWAAFVRLGETPFSLQTPIDGVTLNQTGQFVSDYSLNKDNPKEYIVESKNGIPFKFTYDEKGCYFTEGENGEILDVKGEWFPYGLICHMGSEYNIPFMHLPVLLKGTYKKQKIEFLGSIDRIFAPEGKEMEIMKNATSYVSSYCSGIRQDGRKEWMIGLLCHENGHGLGIYWIDGEEPVISSDVHFEGKWEKLPYVDDGTVVCKNCVWKFGDKDIHIQGKWGSKGFTEKPRMERHGQSQMFGTWYEGKEKYSHKIWNTFNENMEVYEDTMKNRGFELMEGE